MSDFEIVQRPSKAVRKLRGSTRYPIDAIIASADTGTAVRLHMPAHRNGDVRAAGAGGKTDRGEGLSAIRNHLRRRGYALEWSADALSAEHVLVWAVRVEEES